MEQTLACDDGAPSPPKNRGGTAKLVIWVDDSPSPSGLFSVSSRWFSGAVNGVGWSAMTSQ